MRCLDLHGIHVLCNGTSLPLNGSVVTNKDVHCDITNGGMTLELKSEAPKSFLEPEDICDAKMKELWESQDRSVEAMEQFTVTSSTRAKRMSWMLFASNGTSTRRTLAGKCVALCLRNKLRARPTSLMFIALLEVETDVFVPRKKAKIIDTNHA